MDIKQEEFEFTSNEFEYVGRKYDCTFAVKSDIKDIIREANESHGDTFHGLYNEKSLRPNKIRFYIIDDKPVYCMIIYIIDYKHGQNGRYACGNYYPLCNIGDKIMIIPHPFQGSICW